MIRVISAYRVSQEVSSAGILTACKQQFRALVKRKHRITSPKEAFLADLEHELALWTKTDGHEVILTDANETLAEGKNFATFIDSAKLIDVMEILNPSLMDDKTYLWSNRRLDYIFLYLLE